jgi:uncharacterized protein (TIGR03382 family)
LARAASAQWTAISLQAPVGEESFVYAAAGARQGGTMLIAATRQIAPVIWNASSASWTPLIGPGPDSGAVWGMSGDSQVGHVRGRATLWHGSAASLVDLHPSSAFNSYANAVAGDQQVGVMHLNNGENHAVLWHGSAASAVDLHPPGAFDSSAQATDGTRQGGFVFFAGGQHATIWSGSAASVLDLNPGPAFTSVIRGMAGDQQVGYTYSTPPNQNGTHAALWRGSAASLLDLNPFTNVSSELNATTALAQVGESGDPLLQSYEAAIWFGSAESWVGLGRFLPPGYGQSVATSVSFADGLFYVGGYARKFSTGRFEAILWTGIPTPGTASVLLAAGLWASRRRRRT